MNSQKGTLRNTSNIGWNDSEAEALRNGGIYPRNTERGFSPTQAHKTIGQSRAPRVYPSHACATRLPLWFFLSDALKGQWANAATHSVCWYMFYGLVGRGCFFVALGNWWSPNWQARFSNQANRRERLECFGYAVAQDRWLLGLTLGSSPCGASSKLESRALRREIVGEKLASQRPLSRWKLQKFRLLASAKLMTAADGWNMNKSIYFINSFCG